jgi:ribose transport system permease protein
MQTVVRGFTLILAGGMAIIGLPESFTSFGKASILGIQYPIIITLALVILGDIFLRKTRFFRQNFYIGGNEKAALMTGIRVKNIKIFNYVLVSTLAALAGVLMSSRLAAASVNIGVGIELKVIAACVIGGASLSGGEGSIVGAFLGTLFMATIINALNILGVDVYWQNIVSGIILIGAVVLDTVMKERRESLSK